MGSKNNPGKCANAMNEWAIAHGKAEQIAKIKQTTFPAPIVREFMLPPEEEE